MVYDYGASYRRGNSSPGNVLIQLREKLDAWLKVNDAARGLKVGNKW
jgi:hypothetical protein